MGRAVETLLWLWIGLDLSICSVSFPEISDRKFIEECVREHNLARSAVNPPASNMLYMVGNDGTVLWFQHHKTWWKICSGGHS